jgi:hypothetical protein
METVGIGETVEEGFAVRSGVAVPTINVDTGVGEAAPVRVGVGDDDSCTEQAPAASSITLAVFETTDG